MNADNVKIIHGINDGVFDVAGATVFNVRLSLKDAFNIPAEALPFVDGEQVDGNYRLQGNETLEFCKQYGEKGGRYPGGKSKLANRIIPRLELNLNRRRQYREPFFGWGAIGLRLLKSDQLSSMWINDKHPGVAAYWTSVIRYPDHLKRLVRNFTPTRQAFFKFKNEMLFRVAQPVPTIPNQLVHFGFQKLALHRISYSGLGEMAGGPSSEIASRWNPDRICEKISDDHAALSKVAIHHDCCTCLDFEQMICCDDSLIYLDPPYYEQGSKCYPVSFSQNDHIRLAELLHNCSSPWLLSYDDCPQVRSLYDWALMENLSVKYSIGGATTKSKLMICPRR